MNDRKHMSVRVEQATREELEEIAKRRMMATGEAVTLADLIREALGKFAGSELAVNAPTAPGDRRAIQQAAKTTKARPIESSGADVPAHVLQVINSMDVLARFASREGLSADQLADKFITDADPSQRAIADRLSATMPFMDAIGRIAVELEFERAE